jgi:hypothetical protein
MNYKLVDEKSGKELNVGAKVKTSRNERATITALRPPHKKDSSGHVTIKTTDGYEQEYYPSVIGAKYITVKMSAEELAEGLDNFCGSDVFYKHWTNALSFTVGVKFLADNGGDQGAYWLIDAIASHQKRCMKDAMLCEFQLWTIEHQEIGKGCDLICWRDTNDEAFRQSIEYTDLQHIDLKLYVENRTLMLANER